MSDLDPQGVCEQVKGVDTLVYLLSCAFSGS